MDYEKNRIITQEELNKMGEELSNCAESLIDQQFKKISNDMNYEKKYKEALGKAEEFYNDKDNIRYANAEGMLEDIFPELKESEDEKIREYLIRYIDNTMKSSELKSKLLAWLEKQDTPNQTSIWKHWKDGIAGNGEGKPIYLIKYGRTYSLSSYLCFECDYIELSELDNLMLEKQGEQKLQRMVSAEAKEAMYDKPAYVWSEVDERTLKGIIGFISHGQHYGVSNSEMLNWLKSLKQRIGG